MEKKFKTLKNGLGNGLICRINSHDIDAEIESLSKKTITLYGVENDPLNIKNVKPHLFPLSHLTEPIRIEGYNDGKEFVPIAELWKLIHKDSELGYTEIIVHPNNKVFECSDKSLSKYVYVNISEIQNSRSLFVRQMIKWHFNTEGLDPSEFIDASISKVYEPK